MIDNYKTFGYVRVSTKEQNEARQIEALSHYDIDDRDLYIDKVSGKDFDRPEYKRMKSNLRKGDIVVVKSIDRLGRNYTEILKEWQSITKELGCQIIVIDMPLLNTACPKQPDLTSQFVADIVLQILAYVAENERNNIKQRQTEGISIAMKNGVKFGRPRIEKPSEWDTVCSEWVRGDITAVEAMRRLDLKPNTFYRLVKEDKASG